MSKPTKHTIQWLAPHLSDGEVQAIYEAMLEAIGENPPESEWWRYSGELEGAIYARDAAHKAVAKLFGRDNK